ncbi:MAG: hypothetical protein HOO96_07190 [Polyangiaceae bacterium]|nr:hypothetical protein [Polyangiaceae bacterium]
MGPGQSAKVRFVAAWALGCGGWLAVASCAPLDPRVGPLLEDDAGLDAQGRPTDGSTSGTDANNLPDGVAAGVSFALQIRPLINRAQGDPAGGGCRDCHDSTQPRHPGYDMSGFDTSTLKSIRRGGNTSGLRILIAGDPTGSVMVMKLEGRQTTGARMPKGETPWAPADIATLRQWITEGAQGGDNE